MSHITIGTPLTNRARKVMLLGSGELGKEVVIELQRLGIETIAVDRYEGAPAHGVAHHSFVINMLDGEVLEHLIDQVQPDIVVPEVEAIATETLQRLESQGRITVIPTARATRLTMNRRGIRQLASEDLGLQTSPYQFATSFSELTAAASAIGFPCVVKPIMSSSGKGQSIVANEDELEAAWNYAVEGGRGAQADSETEVIVEGWIEFDYEITLLSVRAVNGIRFCLPIGHRQESGDYRESWQPCAMSPSALETAQAMARSVVEALGGFGIFGVEFFVSGDEVWFSEVSPRPHDTGLVTLASQNLSEFALHARAILGLPVHQIRLTRPAASAVILAPAAGTAIRYSSIDRAANIPDSQLLLFGKTKAYPGRRLGVALANADTVEEARQRARDCAAVVEVQVE